jgi:hypothetical protein
MRKKFVFCFYYDREVPVEKNSSGCCEFFNDSTARCDYHKYSISSRRTQEKFYRLSERDDLLKNLDEEDQ